MGQRPSHPSPSPSTPTAPTTTWPPHAEITLWTTPQDSTLLNVTTVTITDGNNASHTLSFTNGTGNIIPPEVTSWWRHYAETGPWWVLLCLVVIGAVLLVVAQLGMRWEDRRSRMRMDGYRLGREKEGGQEEGGIGQGEMMLKKKGNGVALSDV